MNEFTHADRLHVQSAQGWIELGDLVSANNELEEITPTLRGHPDVLTQGALPAGLTFSTNGVLAGTPTNGGDFTFILTASTLAGCLVTNAYALTVNTPIVVAPPTLAITLVGSALVISWPGGATNYSLQQNLDLNPTNWTGFAGTVNTNGPNKTVTLTAPVGNHFFRLHSP